MNAPNIVTTAQTELGKIEKKLTKTSIPILSFLRNHATMTIVTIVSIILSRMKAVTSVLGAESFVLPLILLSGWGAVFFSHVFLRGTVDRFINDDEFTNVWTNVLTPREKFYIVLGVLGTLVLSSALISGGLAK